MLESQPNIHRPILTSFAMLLLLGWLSSQSFAVVSPTDITITTPKYNTVLSSSSVVISGTYSSANIPTITLTVEGKNYGVSYNTKLLTWSSTLSLSNGWHTVKATLNDGGKILVTSSQFMINTGGNKAQVKYPQLNIEYSQACRAMISHGDFTTCPRLSDLIPYDTSNQHYSGKFVQGKYDMVRTNPQLKNAFMWYKNFTICVDCQIDASSEATMQNIFLEATANFPYTKHTSVNVSTNNTGLIKLVPYNYTTTFNEVNAGLTIYHDRYVTDNCMEANLVYSPELLQDTINYMKSGCKITFYNKTTTTIIPFHPIDYKNAPQYQYMNYVAQSLKNNIGNCITKQCTPVKNPQNNFNAEWGGKN